jgi:hypothetical protein
MFQDQISRDLPEMDEEMEFRPQKDAISLPT